MQARSAYLQLAVEHWRATGIGGSRRSCVVGGMAVESQACVTILGKIICWICGAAAGVRGLPRIAITGFRCI